MRGDGEKTTDRIKLFLAAKGLSMNKFSEAVGTSNSYFNKMIRNRASVGSDVIENILLSYPELNATWLLTGKGSMLVDESTGADNPQSVVNEPKPIYEKGNVSLEDYNKLKNEYEGYRRAMKDVLANQLQGIPLEQPPGKIYENSIQDRFSQLVEEIKEYELFDTDIEVAKKLRIEPYVLAEYKAGRRNFTVDFVSKVLSSFDFLDGKTLDWLYTGKGEIINDPKIGLTIKVVNVDDD